MANYSSSLRLVLPNTGEYSGTWGTQVNDGITKLVDTSIAGTATITMTAADYTLSNNNGATDEARAMFLTLTGTPGASYNVICPAVSKLYFVTNNTGYAQTVKTSGGSGISVPNNETRALYCNGTNVVNAINSMGSLSLGSALSVSSGGTGATTLTGYVKGSGTSAFTASSTVPGADVNGNISGNAANVTGTVAVANGGTGQTTIAAKSVFVANALDTFTALTPAAGQSIRINAGNTAWEAYTAGDVSLSAANAFTGANTFYNSTGQTFGTGTSTEDGIIIAGRAGGGSSYRVTLTPTTLSANRTLTLPDASTTVVGTDATQTLTNKNIQSRVVVISDATSVTINADTTDIATQANTQGVGTLTINAPTGTAFNGQKLIFRLTSTNVQTFSWNPAFQGSTDQALPTTSSGSSKVDYMGFIYNSTAAKWQLVAKNFGF